VCVILVFKRIPEDDSSRDRNMLELSIVSKNILNNNSALVGVSLCLLERLTSVCTVQLWGALYCSSCFNLWITESTVECVSDK
jgi:hypothetical protein